MIKTLPVNVSGRDYVVGDMHGMYDLFQEFLAHVSFDKTLDRMISVGDLVDRGPKSLECLSLLETSWFHCAKGNHEQLMQDFLLGGPTGEWWFRNGGSWWAELDLSEKAHGFDLVELIKKLPWLITVKMRGEKKFHVIHAELFHVIKQKITDADLASEATFEQLATMFMGDGEACLWGRYLWGTLYNAFLDGRAVGKLQKSLQLEPHYFNDKLSHIYSGHTCMRQPTTIQGQTNLDTGAFNTKNEWSGLTFTEPLTGKFWTVNKEGVREVQALVI